MSGLLSYIASGRVQAATASSLCAVASLKFPPLSYLSGAVIGVMTLRYGVAEGALMIVGSGAIAGVISWLLLSTALPALAFAVATWIPVWLLAALLRVTRAQGRMLTGASALGALMVVVFHIAVSDAAPWWRDLLNGLFLAGAERGGLQLEPAQIEQLRVVIDTVSGYMTGIIAAGTVLGLVLTVMLARWWQAALDNRGAFAREFRVLRLPRRFGLVAAAVLALAMLANEATGGIAGELVWIVVVAYLLQGLAVIHAIVAGRARAPLWLFGSYLLFGLLPVQGGLVLAMLGYADEWLGLRRRFAGGAD